MSKYQPKSFYYELFNKKRQHVQLTYDFKLTVGFQSGTRWEVPSNPNEFLEFSLRRADFYLELTNGVVDLEYGDTLGGSLQLSAQKKFSNSTEIEDREIENVVEATASLTPSLKNSTGGNEHKKRRDWKTEVDSIHLTISSNFENRMKPFWIFKAADNHLDGHLNMVSLCTVKGFSKRTLSHQSGVVVRPSDVHITHIPKKWIIDVLPFKGLRAQRLKLRIAETITESKNCRENQVVNAS